MKADPKPNHRSPAVGVRINIGRPRRVTDAQVVAILEGREQYLKRKGSRGELKTYNQLARELNLPHSTVADVVRRGGFYKVPSPEMRAVLMPRRQAEMSRQLAPDLGRNRAEALSEGQLDAIRQWLAAAQAASECRRALPCAAEVARHLNITRQSFYRLLERLTHSRQKPGSVGTALGARQLGRVDRRCLLAWKSARDRSDQAHEQLQSLRQLADRLGITVAQLWHTVMRLNLASLR